MEIPARASIPAYIEVGFTGRGNGIVIGRNCFTDCD